MTENEELNFYQRVAKVQQELKAPKDQNNNFGKYKYRSVEDILHKAKSLLSENHLLLIVSDKLVFESGRFYIEATARLFDSLSDNAIEVFGFARESDSKKGMDVAQVTGASSTYARKYALQGLFLLDDSKDDPDAQKQPEKVINTARLTNDQIKQINDLVLKIAGDNPEAQLDKVASICSYYKIKTFGDLYQVNFSDLINGLQKQVK